MSVTQRHPEIFSAETFTARRRRTDPQADGYLQEYMRSFYTPTADDYRALRKAIAYYRKIYDDQVRPIRHEYIAHRQRGAADAVQELFSQVQITALEELLSFLSGLHSTLQEMYQNGNRPKVRLKTIAIQRWLEMSWREMPRQTTAEHAVYQMRKCLDQLVRGSPA